MVVSDIILIGPPGAGKGTMGSLIDRAGLAQHVSTGDLIRDHLASIAPDDPLNARIAAGHFMNDDEITALLVRRIQDVKQRIVFDGFPRNVDQIKILDRIGDKWDRLVTCAIYLALDDDKIVHRITGRSSCRSCGRVYHDTLNPSGGQCECGGTEFLIREDDTEAVLRQRMIRFHHATEPILAVYRTRGILREVNADQPIDRVLNDIMNMVQ